MRRIVPLALLIVFLFSISLIVSRTEVAQDRLIKIHPEIPELPQTVVRVIDGDTFVLLNGRVVRLIGINAPEYGQSYYKEAAARLTELVEGINVTLERDVTNTDNYGRLLRYVYVNDTFVNLEIVRQGYAMVYLIQPNVKYADELVEAEIEAKFNRRGIWP